MKHIAREALIALYLEWCNDFLSVARFAEHHGLTEAQAQTLIALARDVANSEHPEG